jgi:hypothetical protein
MITVHIENVAQVQRQFQNLGQEFGKAMANGINKTAETLIERERLEMQQKIKAGPVPFTLNSHGMFKATPTRPSALVFVKDKQAEYLKSPTQGEPYSGLIPGGEARLNQYGNIISKKGGVAAIKGKSRNAGEFVGKVKGMWGRWARVPRVRGSGEPGRVILVAGKIVNDQREVSLRWNQVAEDWVTIKLLPNIKAEVDAAVERART